jgi:hypothetical protein
MREEVRGLCKRSVIIPQSKMIRIMTNPHPAELGLLKVTIKATATGPLHKKTAVATLIRFARFR